MAEKRYIGVEELKKIQLDMLDDIASFCEENNICYFLAYGTLIGAIRHNGYIPWDDDIDIAMPRPDYDRFIELYNKKESVYNMACYESDKSYSLPFGKVVDTRTVLREGMYDESATFGVYVDVFPIDGYPGVLHHKKLIRLRKMLNAKRAVFGQGRSMIKEIVIFLGKAYLCFTSVNQIVEKIISLSTNSSYTESTKVGYLPSLGGTFENSIFDKNEVFSSFPLHKFEDRMYRIPVGYHKYLTQIYGDYMTCPPKEKQISGHTFEAWWKE